LQDATPLTLGQEFSGYVNLLDRDGGRVAWPSTASTISLSAAPPSHRPQRPSEFAERAARKIAHSPAFLPLASQQIAALSAHDELVFASGALKNSRRFAHEIANDIRGSPPARAADSATHAPENEPGSSIMPGQSNPTQAEAGHHGRRPVWQ